MNRVAPAHSVHSSFAAVHWNMLYGALSIMTLAFSASDTVPVSDTAHVYARRIDFATLGRTRWKLQSGDFAAGLNQVLPSQGVYIRQYGPAGMGTISRRGADPSQVLLLWNGLAVNNPMLGMTDLSLLQTFGQNEITFAEGPNAAFYGSGSVGGTLSVHSAAIRDTGVHVQAALSAGSFGFWSAGSETGYKYRKGFWNVNLTGQGAANRFPYRLSQTERELHRMYNSDLFTGGLRLSGGWSLKHWNFSTHAEYQRSERGLGVTPATTALQGRQQDDNVRLVGEAAYHRGGHRWVNRIGIIADHFIYTNQQTGNHDSSLSLNRQWQSEWFFGNDRIRGVAGADVVWVTGHTHHYAHVNDRIYPAQFLSLAIPGKRGVVAANFRWEWFEKMPSGSLSVEQGFGKHIKARANVGNSFRRPTLNDLFWAGGGNIHLKYETGASAEAGLNLHKETKRIQSELSVTAWTRFLLNPIVWLPENNVWQARNMDRGDYRGCQITGDFRVKAGKTLISAQLNAEYTMAMMQHGGRTFRQIFVPPIVASMKMGAAGVNWWLRLGLNYTAARFISTDNTAELPAFLLPEIQAGRKFRLKKYNLCLSLVCDNVSGTVYQHMPGRPMPMRSYLVRLSLSQPKKQ